MQPLGHIVLDLIPVRNRGVELLVTARAEVVGHPLPDGWKECIVRYEKMEKDLLTNLTVQTFVAYPPAEWLTLLRRGEGVKCYFESGDVVSCRDMLWSILERHTVE